MTSEGPPGHLSLVVLITQLSIDFEQQLVLFVRTEYLFLRHPLQPRQGRFSIPAVQVDPGNIQTGGGIQFTPGSQPGFLKKRRILYLPGQ